VTAPVRGAAEAVRAYLDALNRGSADEIAACVTEDFVNEHTATLGQSVLGRSTYHQRLGGFLTAFSGLHYQVERLIADGGDVAVAYRMTAQWCETAAATPRPFAIRGMFRFEVRDGLVCHRVDYWDSGEFRRQVQAD
jgi:steroid delta-isomerase-like uncharacterized protein